MTTSTSDDEGFTEVYMDNLMEVIRAGQDYEYTGPARPRPRFAEHAEPFAVELPDGKELGRCTDISISPINGDIFLLNYQIGAFTPTDPARRLNWIVRLDSDGRYIADFGGPESVPQIDGVTQWPTAPEQVECDAEGNVWVTGFHPTDTVILRYSADGEFIRQYFKRKDRGDNADTTRIGPAATVYHDVMNRELFVADGYGNTRVIAFNSDTGEFTRMWGAYGKDPSSLSPEESFGVPVHQIAPSPDGLIYVCDRLKNRVQEFELVPGGVNYLREVYTGPQTYTASGDAFNIAFTPDNKYLFVAGGSAMRVWTVDRATFEVLGWTSVTEHEGDDNIGISLLPLHVTVRVANGDLLLGGRTKGFMRLKYLGVS